MAKYKHLLIDFWLLFGRLFPLPVEPGLVKIGKPDRNSPVLITANFELSVRVVRETLEKAGVDAWLVVAATKGTNVWCAAGAGDFTADTVLSSIKTSGIERLVDHRIIYLPQLAAAGINIWDVRERSDWRPRFGPADIADFPAFLRSKKARTDREHRMVKFEWTQRFVMGTNLGFNVSLLLIVPLLIVSIWIPGLWWNTLPLLFILSLMSSLLVFWLPGKIGLQKGLSLGAIATAVLVFVDLAVLDLSPVDLLLWASWLMLLSGFVGYDMPSWSPLWRQDIKELVLGEKNTYVEVIADKCIGCHMCDIVCPTNVFARNQETKKYEVVNLDACEACGACIENCPTDAIVNNFRESACACPTCFVIEGSKSFRKSMRERS